MHLKARRQAQEGTILGPKNVERYPRFSVEKHNSAFIFPHKTQECVKAAFEISAKTSESI